jgi:hypothetical protein
VTLSLIRYQFENFQTQGSPEYRIANSRKFMINGKSRQKLGQLITQNNEVLLEDLDEKRCKQCILTVFISVISRNLNRLKCEY